MRPVFTSRGSWSRSWSWPWSWPWLFAMFGGWDGFGTRVTKCSAKNKPGVWPGRGMRSGRKPSCKPQVAGQGEHCSPLLLTASPPPELLLTRRLTQSTQDSSCMGRMYCPVLLLDMAYSVIQPVSSPRGPSPLCLPEVLLPQAHSNHLSSLCQNRPMHGICERNVFSIAARGYPYVWFATRYAGGRPV